MNIFKEIEKLNFPTDEYVVMGGAALAARGLKETDDVDMIVSNDLLEKCRKEGKWELHSRMNPDQPSGLHCGDIELYPNVGHDNFNPTFKELRERAIMINNVPVCSLEDIIEIKRSFGREKDLIDVEKIIFFKEKGGV